jgi:hypothetical protein
MAEQIQGDPNNPMRGVVQQFNAYVPNPQNMSAEQFNWVLNLMERGQDRLIEEGVPARTFKNSNLSVDDARAYNNQLEAIRAERDAEARANRAAPTECRGGAGAVDLTLANLDARAKAKLQQAGNDPAYRRPLIEAGKANGVDLEAGGF